MTQITTQQRDGIEIFSCLPSGRAQRRSQRPPVLFIHGAFAGGWMWTDTFMPALAEAGHACHALSLRGHGGSAGREHIDWHSINDYVDDVCAVVDWLGETPVLAGHSMGGFVVQKYLEKHDAAGAALLCSVPPQGLIAAQFHLLFQKPQLFLEINRIMGGEYTDTTTLQEALFAGEVDQRMLAAWLTRMQAESHRAIWDMSMFNLPSLSRIQAPPMLVLGAEHDVLIPPDQVRLTARRYDVEPQILPGLGHGMMLESDWRVAADPILAWLKSLDL